MTVSEFKQVTAVEAARRFSEVNDAALREPVVLTRNGRARTVLLSVETFERYLANERSVVLAKDTPTVFSTRLRRWPWAILIAPMCPTWPISAARDGGACR